MSAPLLEVQDLRVQFGRGPGTVCAVNGVSFALERGEILAIVGESGSGKSVLSRSILRLVREPPGRTVGGRILFEGQDVMTLRGPALQALRGDAIAMIFQEPMTSLNPVLTIGFQIAEALRQHRKVGRAAARQMAIGLLEQVGLADAARRYDAYPSQISGGMCQRAMIAMALACRPRLLIADEPTTALDVTIQAQILSLLRRLRDELGMAVILVTHNLGVVAEIADRVAVMYAGQIVETAPVQRFFDAPLHPYSRGLMESMPRLDRKLDRLPAISGAIRPVRPADTGCHFRERCAQAMPQCGVAPPIATRNSTTVRCWLHAP